MTMVQIPVDEKLLASAGVDPAHAGEEFRLLAAVKLFELRRITLGQGAELAALSLWGFIDALRRFGVSWSNLTDEQIEHDIRCA
jgi:predicted HTH domain antitoxin